MKIIIPANAISIPEKSLKISHHGDYYLNLLGCLGYSTDKPPVAELLKQLHGLAHDWLVVSPIHWLATHNDVMIIASGKALELNDDEGRAWFAAFKALTAPWGFEVFYHNAYTWLIQPHQAPALCARPVSSLQHQSMMPALESLDKTLFWQRLLTETQLFFSAHPLNQHRSKQLPINGVWFWGGGHLDQHESDPAIVIQDESLTPLAQVLSKNIQLAVGERRYPKNTVFLAKNGENQALSSINLSQAHTWYWNNCAYRTKPISWLKRLLR